MWSCKNCIILVLSAALAGCLVYIFWPRDQDPVPVLPSIAIAGPADAQVLHQYIDSAGSQHVVINADVNEIQRSELNRAAAPIAQLIKAKMDSVAAAMDVKLKNLNGYTAVVFSASADSVRILRRTVDSLKRQTFYYRDKYLALTFRAGSLSDSLTASNFDFSYNVDLRTVDYDRRDKLLGLRVGRRRYFTDISSSDPRVRIKGVEKFTIARRAPAFGLRVQALASYNFTTRNYAAGAGVRLDVGDRFNAGLNYTYNFGLGSWTPIIYTKYDILQFGR